MSDRAKSLLKGGWHPPGDPTVHRATWKQDLKNIATGKQNTSALDNARNHQSTPLSSLRDPNSFGAPPKATQYYSDTQASPTSVASAAPQGPQGGLASVVPTASRTRQQEQVSVEEPTVPQGPYRTDTTGLRTDNLPKPPVRRVDGAGSPAPSSPGLPPRQAGRPVPAPPPRQTTGHAPAMPPRQNTGPPPVLPPRQNEYPDEHTPAPPPTYGQAVNPNTDAGQINLGAATRLSQAGISIPGFGIGTQSAQPDSAQRGPQLSELQQRFARMNTGAGSQESQPSSSISNSAAGKKAPPPPPPKKSALAAGSRPSTSDGNQPPPLPLSSKPRPG